MSAFPRVDPCLHSLGLIEELWHESLHGDRVHISGEQHAAPDNNMLLPTSGDGGRGANIDANTGDVW